MHKKAKHKISDLNLLNKANKSREKRDWRIKNNKAGVTVIPKRTEGWILCTDVKPWANVGLNYIKIKYKFKRREIEGELVESLNHLDILWRN